MRMMKRTAAAFLTVIMVLPLSTGCKGNGKPERSSAVSTVSTVATKTESTADTTLSSVCTTERTAKTSAESPNHKTTSGNTKTSVSISKSNTVSKPVSTTQNEVIHKMYVSWDSKTKLLQVAQKYSMFYDFVMVLKPLGPNSIFNIAPPKRIYNGDTNRAVSSLLGAAPIVQMAESDWFGPHVVNSVSFPIPGFSQFTGGTHGASGSEDASKGPSGRSDNIALKLDGKPVAGDYEGYSDKLEITWDTYVQALNTLSIQREVLVEHHTMNFDGKIWNFHTEIEFLEEVKWRIYYGAQCVYGPWCERVTYSDGSSYSITGNNAATQSANKLCDTILLNKGNEYLEMYLDSSYGIGDRRYLAGDASGAFTAAYGSATNGKAYFNLVNGKDWTMEKGQKVSYRGHYRFFVKMDK